MILLLVSKECQKWMNFFIFDAIGCQIPSCQIGGQCVVHACHCPPLCQNVYQTSSIERCNTVLIIHHHTCIKTYFYVLYLQVSMSLMYLLSQENMILENKMLLPVTLSSQRQQGQIIPWALLQLESIRILQMRWDNYSNYQILPCM